MNKSARYIAAALCAVLATASHAERSVPAIQWRAGESLETALRGLDAHGIRVVFSSALVRPEMTVRKTPKSSEFGAALQEVVGAWGLQAIRVEGGDWLIVRAPSNPQATQESPEPETTRPLIETIDVTATRYDIAGAGAAPQYFDRQDVERMPHVFDDAVRMLKVLPGVNGGDYSARLHVRGGRRDETKLVIDGAEIHGGFHFREVDGMVSIMDTNLVESLELTTGGMTAEHSDAMSGLVNIRSLQPEPDDAYRHAAGVSFVSAFVRSSGVFDDDKGSWLASARRGYLDLLVDRVQPDEEQLVPRFQDVFAKVRYELGESTDFSAYLLLATNELKFTEETDDVESDGRAEDAQVWITLDHEFSDTLRSTTLAAFATTDDIRDVSGQDEDIAADLWSRTESKFIDLKQDWTLTLDDRSLLRWGAVGAVEDVDYRYYRTSFILDPYITQVPIDTSLSSELSASAKKWGTYAAYRHAFANGVTTEVGARYDSYHYPHQQRYSRVNPRVNVAWQIGNRTALRAAWGDVHQPQGAHQLQIEDGVESFFQPERARYSLLGVEQQIASSVSLRVDLYRKEYEDLRPRFENAVDPIELVPEATTDRIRIDAPRARSTGVEVSVRRPVQDAWGGWLSYAYARAEEEEDNRWRPRSWDSRNTVSFGLTFAGAVWSANLTGLYQSGAPTTAINVEAIQDGGSTRWIAAPGTRNGERMEYFARVDGRLSRKAQFSNSALTYYFEIINLLNRENPCCVEDYELTTRNGPRLVPEYSYWLPLLPSFGFRYEF